MIKNKYSTRFKATLLAFLLPASGIMTAYAITDPQPAQTDFKVERISEELPAVYVEPIPINPAIGCKKLSKPVTLWQTF